MKRQLAFLLVLGLVAGLLAPSAATAKKKKAKKPVPVDVVYHIVWNDPDCALSVTTAAASDADACEDPFAGATQDQLGSGPFAMPALDGLPLTLDTSKTIKASITAVSYSAALGPDVIGIGQAELHAILTGTSGGQEITIGEVTTEPYTVTPASNTYTVDFEFTPAPELNNKTFDGITLAMELRGNQMFHGVFPADGSSTLTFGAFATK